jgi:hypothetical protein
MASDIKAGTQTEGVSEQSAREHIPTDGGLK